MEGLTTLRWWHPLVWLAGFPLGVLFMGWWLVSARHCGNDLLTEAGFLAWPLLWAVFGIYVAFLAAEAIMRATADRHPVVAVAGVILMLIAALGGAAACYMTLLIGMACS